MDFTSIFKGIVSSVLFSILGMALLALGFYILDKLTPGDLWKEMMEKQNTALAIVVGAFALGLSIIIALSIHG